MSNFMIGRRRAGVKYEYNGDGRFDQARWNKSDKRYWTRWLRRIGKEDLEERINDVNKDGEVCCLQQGVGMPAL